MIAANFLSLLSVMVVCLVGESFYAQTIFSTVNVYDLPCFILAMFSSNTSGGMRPVKSDKVSSTSWGGLLKFSTVLSSINWVIVPCIVTVSYSLWSLRTSCIEMGCQLWIMETVFSHLWCSHFGHVVYNNFLAILCLGIVDKFFGVFTSWALLQESFFWRSVK